MEEIASALALPLSPETLERRSLAYASLLQLQRQQCEGEGDAATLFPASASLIPFLLLDASVRDEEIAAQALKCLGFFVYHPSIAPLISEEVANAVLELLTKLVTTTEMKAICNLGVWCISIQLLDASFIKSNLLSLLKTIVYAMDNSFGSLSITYEAFQAVMRLASQLPGSMREMAYIWAPPVYKRLASADKKERDMSMRCLLKLEQVVFPPPHSLSKEVSVDLKNGLIARLSELSQDSYLKIISIQAWKWYIRLLGQDALKRKDVVNKMLKILEKGFTEPSSCIQMASLEAWEAVIDALTPDNIHQTGTSMAEDGIAPEGSCKLPMICCLNDGILRRIDLLMKPILRIFSSKSSASVHMCSVRTWYYLLSRLDLLVNHPSIKAIILNPVLELAFSKEYGDMNMWFWDCILNLISECCLSKLYDRNFGNSKKQSCHCYIYDEGDADNSKKHSCHIYDEGDATMLPFDYLGLGKTLLIKWLPWECSDMTLFMKVILCFIRQTLKVGGSPKCRDSAFDVSLKIFKLLLEGTKVEMKKVPGSSCSKQSCVDAIIQFMKNLCQDVDSCRMLFNESYLDVIYRFVEAIRNELDFILESQCFTTALDITYLKEVHLVNEGKYLEIRGIEDFAYMDVVSPMVYLEILCHHMVLRSLKDASDVGNVLHSMCLLTSLFFSSNLLQHLHVIVSLIYVHWRKFMLSYTYRVKLWMLIAENLNLHINRDQEHKFLNGKEFPDGGCLIQRFLSYPISICCILDEYFSTQNFLGDSKVFLEDNLELEPFFKVWTSFLYSLLCAPQFKDCGSVSCLKGLCELLAEILCKNAALLPNVLDTELNMKLQNFFLVEAFVKVSNCLLKASKYLQSEALNSARVESENDVFERRKLLKASFELLSRTLQFPLKILEATQGIELDVPRVLADVTQVICCLKLKHHIELLIEVISGPLRQWLSSFVLLQQKIPYMDIACKLQLLWVQLLECLQGSEPPVASDSSSLRLLSPLLQITLDHPHLPISEATFAFCSATFGKGNLCYPECLLPVIRKFQRKGLLNVQKRGILLRKGTSLQTNNQKGSLEKLILLKSKSSYTRVNKETWNGHGQVNIESQAFRNKRCKLVEHAKNEDKGHYWVSVPCASKQNPKSSGQSSKANGPVREIDTIMEMLKR